MNINDGSTSDTIKGTVNAVSGVEGLYKVTYQINDSTMERYLLVVDRRIGDVNSDGAVNGIDANNLVGKDADANGGKTSACLGCKQGWQDWTIMMLMQSETDSL